MLNTCVSDEAAQFERQREDVAVVTAVPDDERAVRFALQDGLGRGAADGPPVPAALEQRARSVRSGQIRSCRVRGAADGPQHHPRWNA